MARVFTITPLATFLFTLLAAFPAYPSTTHTVVIRQMRFEPADLKVERGDIIIWTNDDIFSHSVTANDGSFDSGLIAPGTRWQTVVKDAAGYHCRPHPNMTAQILLASGATVVTPRMTLRWSPPTSPEQFHPILVNFTAALLPLAFLSDLIARMMKRESLHAAGFWMVVYAAIITPFTAAAGWWWKHVSSQTLPPEIIVVHQWLGTVAAIAFLGLALWRWSFYRRKAIPSLTYLGLAAILTLALIYQGSLGGAMVFGK